MSEPLPRLRYTGESWQPVAQASTNAYAAASRTDPALENWYPVGGSADADLLDDLKVIRPRGRDLTRNNGYAAAGEQTLSDNILGHQLILASAPDHVLLGWDRAEAKQWARTTEHEFVTWAQDAGEIDAGRTLDLLGLTSQALNAWFQNGEALAIPHWLPRDGARWNTRLQMIESDRIETPPDRATDPSIRAGVHVDSHGAPIGYWIRSTHPGDRYGLGITAVEGSHAYVPAFTAWGRRRVIHLFDQRRAEQHRGQSLLSSIMREFRMGTAYPRIELEATLRSALISAFLTSDLSQADSERLFSDYDDFDAAESAWAQRASSVASGRIQGGRILPLPLGAKIEAFNPQRPNQAFEQFMISTLRNISAGLNLPYELLAKDFSRTNYSSARAALLEAWRYFLGRRRWLTTHWLTPIYELWLEEAVNAGKVIAPDYYAHRYAYRRCTWTMAGRGWVDPLKEANAAAVRMGNHITTLRHECAEQGLDWEEVIEQRAEEMALMRALGLETRALATPTVEGQTDQSRERDASIAERDDEPDPIEEDAL